MHSRKGTCCKGKRCVQINIDVCCTGGSFISPLALTAVGSLFDSVRVQVEVGKHAYYRVGRNYTTSSTSAAASPHFVAEQERAILPQHPDSSTGFGASIAVGDGNDGWIDLVMRRTTGEGTLCTVQRTPCAARAYFFCIDSLMLPGLYFCAVARYSNQKKRRKQVGQGDHCSLQELVARTKGIPRLQPTPVVDTIAKKVFLLSSLDNWHMRLQESTDDGMTWTPSPDARDLDASLRKPVPSSTRASNHPRVHTREDGCSRHRASS